MKIRFKTLTIFFLLFFLISNLSYSQNNSNKIRINSISSGFGAFYFEKSNSEGGGASFVLNGNLESNKNLVNLCFLTGAEIGVVGSSTYNFNEFSATYGRELQFTSWFSIESFAGLGYYYQNSKNSSVVSGNSISFPIKLNLIFYFTNKIGVGIYNSYSINQLNNNLSTNLILHYKF
jgi:hypothetical protein